MMNIQYYIPPKLHGIADMIWEQHAEKPSKWKILPSGKVELIFRIGSDAKIQSAKRINQNNSPLQHFCFLSGLHTKPLVMSFEQFSYIGIQMKPFAVKALFGIPLSKFRDYFVEGDNLFKVLNKIEDKLLSPLSFFQKAVWLEEFIFSKIIESPDLQMVLNLNKITEKFVSDQNAHQSCTVEDLLGYSRTHTFRLFNEWFGISGHSYEKLVRFVRSLHSLHCSSSSLTEIGLQNGYFDQAHFIRSFKEFSEMTPGVYKKLKSDIPGQLAI